MNELLTILKDLIPYLVTLVITITTLLTCIVNSKINAERVKILKEELEKARKNETYFVCPECHKKIPLSDLSFYLPTGQVDNNLNGIADELE